MKTFQVKSTAIIEVKAGCNVAILPNDTGIVGVEIKGDQDAVKVSQSGDTISIEHQYSQSGSVVIGNVVMSNSGRTINIGGSSGGINISGSGKVIINGREINLDEFPESESAKPVEIVIHAPIGSDLDAELDGVARLAASVRLGDVSLNCQGSTESVLECQSLNVDISGSGTVSAVVAGGVLDADVSGSGKVKAKGKFESVNASISGMGQVSTQGVCSGNYKANVSGMGQINHIGGVGGRVRKSVSGMGSVKIG